MSAPETLSLTFLGLGVSAILRFVWLDSLRFSAVPGDAEVVDSSQVSPPTVKRLALEAEAARVLAEAENDRLPKAA